MKFDKDLKSFPENLNIPLKLKSMLRYGENPHQRAAIYMDNCDHDFFIKLQGKKELSYNNIVDMNACMLAVISFENPACVIVKHANPCGAAIHDHGLSEAFKLALQGDPTSAYGGIVAFNRQVEITDVLTVKKSHTFFEIICAPSFTDEALECLAMRKKLRVIQYTDNFVKHSFYDIKYQAGCWLIQENDSFKNIEWNVVTKHTPSLVETDELKFAWKICRFVKSNAVVLVCSKDGGIMLSGSGGGQTSRVDSVNLALMKSTQAIEKCVMASDGFFPFADGPALAMKKGVKAFIQPGGSIRDNLVITTVNSNNGVMVMTGIRHFNH